LARYHTSTPLLLMAILLPTAVGAQTDTGTGRELIRDPHFRRGFVVYDPAPGKKVVRGAFHVDPDAGEPVWGLAQWHSKHSLAGTKPHRLPSRALRWANPAKAVIVAPPGSEDADLVLAIDSRVEYSDRARRKGEDWPHLLVSQRIESSPHLAEMAALQFEISARLRRSEAFRTEDYSPHLHAAQYVVVITVQNLNRESEGYGDFLWFGIPLYDDRWRIPRPFTAPDQAQSKFIYTPPGEAFTTDSTHDGEWITIRRDLRPLMLDALSAAWERGFLPDSRDLADYRLGGISAGWELTGILDVELQTKDLSLKALLRH
jgi:hypothetical protein